MMSVNDWKQFQWVPLPFKDLQTEEGETRYYIIDENTKFPSMTSILGMLDDGGVDAWRKRVGEEEAERIVKEAVARGNNLHELSELYLMNKLERSGVKGPGSILFNRSRRHLNELGPIVGIEVALYSLQRRYAGRVDCIAFHDKHLCIVDHKNSRRKIDLSKDYACKKLYAYMLQTVGYAFALKEMFPHLPMATHGVLIVGNFDVMSSDKFKFKFTQDLCDDFDFLLKAYYGEADINDARYFKPGLSDFIKSILVS
ncbi:hypothetical protein pf16_140 [Pseudomonas phage pf16]|uniref:Uncharacterized protein n=1 Tax=Pseudomonas phage pf16 TaxID=1815630 RepID=A0A1S5R418_9CAUD|nr:exonuclease [Pseudomonas phage pf16]AND75063.1 hypothetical protein pf16_140 [Pseudomonas phage pf16]